METILTVKNEHLLGLGPQKAVEFFRELIWAEANLMGIPLVDISISTRVDVPDGGIDAYIKGGDRISPNGLIHAGHNYYQIKAGEKFKPTQEQQIKKELFGKNPPSKDALNHGIRECMDRNGFYVLVCFGIDLVHDQCTKAKNKLNEFLVICGYKNPQIDIWSQNQLIGFLKAFPALALKANNHSYAHFFTYSEWAAQEEMGMKFVTGETQDKLTSIIQTELRVAGKPVNIRVWGEPGIGKTRLVLEATNTDDLRPLVIYCSAGNFRDSDLMGEIRRGTFYSILILDECTFDELTYIWNVLKVHSPRIKVITIFAEYDNASDINYLDIPGLTEEQISSIIKSYGIPDDKANDWAKECSGSPRVAHVVGNNLVLNPDDILKSPATVNIWDRFISGNDDPKSVEVHERQLVLRFLSLFKRFGYVKPVADEAEGISQIINKADPLITQERFQEIVAGLRKRKILQGENTLYITPKLLQVKLWIDWWEIYGNNFDIYSLNVTPKLFDWFFEMFEYAAGSPVASKIVRDLLGVDGPFQQNNAELLENRLGARFFHYLAEAEPEAALSCLQKTIGKWNSDKLLKFSDGRREVIGALEKISRWWSLFAGAARLILVLGEAENEAWSNNASGVFAELFTITLNSRIGKTEAPPSERFPIIKEAVESASKEQRKLGLKACDRALGIQEAGWVTNIHRIVGKTPILWYPKTYGELFDAYRQVWDFLVYILDVLPEDERQIAINILLNRALEIGEIHALSLMVVETLRGLAQRIEINKRRILEVVLQFLRLYNKDFPGEINKSWKELRNELIGDDFESHLKRYVSMSFIEDKFDEDGNITHGMEIKISELAQQASEDHSLILPSLNWLVTPEAENGYIFGYNLGQRDKTFSLLQPILEGLRNAEKKSALFAGGYFRSIIEEDETKWELLMDDLMGDADLNLLLPELTWRSGIITNRSGKRLLRFVKKNDNFAVFNYFAYGDILRRLNSDVFKQWIDTFTKSHEIIAILTALDLYSSYYLEMKANRKLPKIRTQNLLTHQLLFQPSPLIRQDPMAPYHWKLIAEAFITRYPEACLTLAKPLVNHFGEERTIVEEFRPHVQNVLGQIAQLHPKEVWVLIARILVPPLDARAFNITHWLRGAEGNGVLSVFPINVIFGWVDENVEKRAWYLASFVPNKLHRVVGKSCWAREVLKKYGDRDDVRRNLMANFSTGSWWGPRSLHLMEKKRALLEFRDAEKEKNVILWIDEYIHHIDEDIEREKIEEEREDY